MRLLILVLVRDNLLALVMFEPLRSDFLVLIQVSIIQVYILWELDLVFGIIASSEQVSFFSYSIVIVVPSSLVLAHYSCYLTRARRIVLVRCLPILWHRSLIIERYRVVIVSLILDFYSWGLDSQLVLIRLRGVTIVLRIVKCACLLVDNWNHILFIFAIVRSD